MYTANIADTVMFRNLGKHPSPHLQKLKSAVEDAGTEIWVPAAVYHELADTGSADSPTNPYLDTAIEEGWLRVAPSLPGDRTEGSIVALDQLRKHGSLQMSFSTSRASIQRRTTGRMRRWSRWQFDCSM